MFGGMIILEAEKQTKTALQWTLNEWIDGW
jgi:hypothetical protein